MSGALSEFPISADSAGGGSVDPPFVVPVTGDLAGISDAELLTLWKSVTDPGYHQPILEKENGGGDEVKAMLAIHRAVSLSVDASTQSLYILPFSGQTGEPAHLQRVATGFLQFERVPTDKFPAWLPVVFMPDELGVDHVGIDWSPEGPLEVVTGRRYFLDDRSVLGPGVLGPLLYPAHAAKAGHSYNLPGPGTIVRPYQPGATLHNTGLSMFPQAPGVNWMILAPAPDLLSDAHIGQYLRLMETGAPDQIRRMIGYLPPLDSTSGGTVVLDAVGVFKVDTIVGAFELGEEVFEPSTGAKGTLLDSSNGHFTLEATTGGPFDVGAIEGTFSGATANISEIVRQCEIASAEPIDWEVLDWELDVGLTITNPESFSGGRLPVLEELGAERNIPHASGEPEEVYRRRVANAADVVSPNALLRAANRILAEYGGRGCLREVGSAKLPGLFYDVAPDGNPEHAFAFDMDGTLRIGDTYKLLLDFTEFRGFFLMGVPLFGLGDFSAYADTDPGFDGDAYLDGYAVTDAALHSAVYSSLLNAKAGGVGFDLYIEPGGCV